MKNITLHTFITCTVLAAGSYSFAAAAAPTDMAGGLPYTNYDIYAGPNAQGGVTVTSNVGGGTAPITTGSSQADVVKAICEAASGGNPPLPHHGGKPSKNSTVHPPESYRPGDAPGDGPDGTNGTWNSALTSKLDDCCKEKPPGSGKWEPKDNADACTGGKEDGIIFDPGHP